MGRPGSGYTGTGTVAQDRDGGPEWIVPLQGRLFVPKLAIPLFSPCPRFCAHARRRVGLGSRLRGKAELESIDETREWNSYDISAPVWLGAYNKRTKN